jgi:hypothetical protein
MISSASFLEIPKFNPRAEAFLFSSEKERLTVKINPRTSKEMLASLKYNLLNI